MYIFIASRDITGMITAFRITFLRTVCEKALYILQKICISIAIAVLNSFIEYYSMLFSSGGIQLRKI